MCASKVGETVEVGGLEWRTSAMSSCPSQFKFSQGPWNATILHDPLHWALSQYVEVADTEQAY